MTIKTRLDVAMALVLNLPAAAFAAESASVNEEQMVVTASGFSQERREAPATISVLDEKALNTRSNQNISEALREMPGVLWATVTAAWRPAMFRCAAWIRPIPRIW